MSIRNPTFHTLSRFNTSLADCMLQHHTLTHSLTYGSPGFAYASLMVGQVFESTRSSVTCWNAHFLGALAITRVKQPAAFSTPFARALLEDLKFTAVGHHSTHFSPSLELWEAGKLKPGLCLATIDGVQRTV